MKIRFYGTGIVSMEQMERNEAYCATLGLPVAKGTGRTRLAVIGGGPSIKDRLEEIRNFDGDRWIVPSAFMPLLDMGIEGAFVSVDPQAFIADFAKGAKHAILATCSAPEVFDSLAGAKIETIHLVHDAENQNHGPSTASSTLVPALYAGYKEIVFYGCESSYAQDGQSHAFEDARHPYRILVKAGDKEFYTEALLLLQAEYIATMIRLAPKVFSEQSGGLLRALVADMEYDILAGTPELHEFLRKAA